MKIFLGLAVCLVAASEGRISHGSRHERAGGGYPRGGNFGGGNLGGGDYEDANYNFMYEVQDAASGNDFGHQESRQGHVATGSYHVLLPDGRMQTVQYTADQGGYQPVVSYQGGAGGSGGAGGAGGGGGGAGGYRYRKSHQPRGFNF